MTVLDLLDRPYEFWLWQKVVGSEEASRQLEAAAREVIRRDGPRAIIPITNKVVALRKCFENADAVPQEFTCEN